VNFLRTGAVSPSFRTPKSRNAFDEQMDLASAKSQGWKGYHERMYVGAFSPSETYLPLPLMTKENLVSTV